MNVPSPFQQREAGGTDAKSMLPGGAAPIKVGAQPVVGPMTPIPAPTPLAPRAPATPAPLVAPAPGAGPVAAPPATPQMVPAYLAKAMQKQQEKLAAEHAMVPAPAVGAPATPAAPVAPVAPVAATPEPAPAPERAAAPVAPTNTTAAVTTEAAGTTTTAPTNTTTATPAQVTPPTDPSLVVVATDTPEQASQKTAAQKTQDALIAKYTEYANAKEDPAFVAQYNKLLIDSAIQNQAAIDATKRAIASNPDLAGQPAGDAMLGLKAIQLGSNLSDLKATLSVEGAKAVADLNKYGLEGLYKLNQDKMSQDDKDVLAYGQVLDRMISSGASDEDLRAYYDKTIKPLLGGKDISFDQFRSPAERQALIAGVQTDGLSQMRDALDRGDTPGALQALEAAYSPARQTELGKSLIGSTDVATINKWLKDAGYDAITTAADLIGREDDVFIAQQISQGKAKINESPLQPQIDALLGSLKGKVDITDPDVLDAVHEYIYQQEYGDPEQPNVLPWDSDVTSYKYKDWEVFDPKTGAVVSKGNEFYDPTHNPEPKPGDASYDWKNSLDTAWQKYLAANPDSKTRLSRDDWFAKFKTDYTDYTKKNPDGSLDGFLNGTTSGTGGSTGTPWTAGSGTGTDENLPAIKDKGQKALAAQADVSKINFDDPNVKAYLASLPATLPAQIGNATTFGTSNIGNWIKFGDKYYRVDNGEQHRFEKKTTAGNSSFTHRDIMQLTGQDGKQVWVDSDGKIFTTPPPKDRQAFYDWYTAGAK